MIIRIVGLHLSLADDSIPTEPEIAYLLGPYYVCPTPLEPSPSKCAIFLS